MFNSFKFEVFIVFYAQMHTFLLVYLKYIHEGIYLEAEIVNNILAKLAIFDWNITASTIDLMVECTNKLQTHTFLNN